MEKEELLPATIKVRKLPVKTKAHLTSCWVSVLLNLIRMLKNERTTRTFSGSPKRIMKVSLEINMVVNPY